MPAMLRLSAMLLALLPLLPGAAPAQEGPEETAAILAELQTRRAAQRPELVEASEAVRRLGNAATPEAAQARARLAEKQAKYRQLVQAEMAVEYASLKPAERGAYLNRRQQEAEARTNRIQNDCRQDLANGLRMGGDERERAYSRVDALLRTFRAEQDAIDGFARSTSRDTGSRSIDVDRMSMLLDRATKDHRLQPYADNPDHNAQIWILERQREEDVAEYRRLAAHASFHDPRTGETLAGTDREHIRRDAERTLAATMRRRGREGVMAWLYNDKRRTEAEALSAELAAPENAALDAVTGRGTDMRRYFTGLAHGIRRSEADVDEWFDKDYLPAGDSALAMLPNIDPERWYRSLGSGETTVGAVRRRIESMHREADDAVALLERASRAATPAQLSDADRRSLRAFGYIRRDERGIERWAVPTGTGAVSAATQVENMPGGTWLRALSLKNVGVTVASVALPEIAAARAAAFVGRLGAAERTIAATRLLVNTGTGMVVSGGMQYLETGHVDVTKLAAETAFMGVAGHGLNAATSAVTARLANAFRNPATRETAKRYISEALGLTSDAALQSYYTAYGTEKWPTFDDFLANLVGSALSRGATAGVDHIRDGHAGPKFLRDLLTPSERGIMADRARHLFREGERIRGKFSKASGGRTADKVSATEIYGMLARGDVSWTELKSLFALYPHEFKKVMGEVADLRGKHYGDLVKSSQSEARNVLRTEFVRRRDELLRQPETPERGRKLDELDAWRKNELAMINSDPLKPGSGGVTSDIDRSHASPIMRDVISRRGEEMLRLHSAMSEGPTSARALDVNEYYNVMNSIAVPILDADGKPTGRYQDRELRNRAAFSDVVLPENGFRHAEAVESNSFAAAMLHMTENQRRVWQDNKLRAARTPAERALLERQFEAARKSLREAKTEIDAEIHRMAGAGARRDDPNTAIRAREAVYSRRCKELHELEIAMRKLAPGSEEWCATAARLEQKMNVALREGIETYSTAPGVDLIVNVLQGKKPNGDKKTVRELMADPALKLHGELGKTYTAKDLDLMINDQVMMMVEHVNAYYHGHEGPYLAGRALSKYAERVLLALNVQGVDILKLAAENPQHPYAKVLALTEKLQACKDDPQGLVRVLAEMGGLDARKGMREMFDLLEELPGMRGMTDAKRATGADSGPDTLAASMLHSRMTLRHRWEREREAIRNVEGDEAARDFTAAEKEGLTLDLKDARAELAERRRLGGKYRVEDFARARQLESELDLLELRLAHHTGGESDPERKELEAEAEAKRAQLTALTGAYRSAKAEGKLTPDADAELLERQIAFLEARDRELAEDLAAEEERIREGRDGAMATPAPEGAIVSHFEESTEGWTAVGGRNARRRLPYHAYDAKRGQRYAELRDELVPARGPVDLVICFDVSSSMGPYINAMRTSAEQIVRRLKEESQDVRLGLVAFRDTVDAVPFQDYPLTEDLASRFADMNAWKADGGGDVPEDPWIAIDHALKMAWRTADAANHPVAKAILVVTDAAGKQKDREGNSLESIARKVRERSDLRVYSLVAGKADEAVDHAEELAVRTGGESVVNLSPERLTDALLDMVHEAFERGDPRLWLAPDKFPGDRSSFLGRTLEYQLHLPRAQRTFPGDDLMLRGTARSLAFRGRPFLVPGWNRICVELKAGPGWIDLSTGRPASDDDLKAVLGDLRRLEIRGQYSSGRGTSGIDAVVFGGAGEPTDTGVPDEARVWLNRFERWLLEIQDVRTRLYEKYCSQAARDGYDENLRRAGVASTLAGVHAVATEMESMLDAAGAGMFNGVRQRLERSAAALRRGGAPEAGLREQIKARQIEWRQAVAKLEDDLKAVEPKLGRRAVLDDALAYKPLGQAQFNQVSTNRDQLTREAEEIRRRLQEMGDRFSRRSP